MTAYNMVVEFVRTFSRDPGFVGALRASAKEKVSKHYIPSWANSDIRGPIMNRLASTLAPAYADHIGPGTRECRRGRSSPLLLVCLVRVVSLVFFVCLAFWSLWFLCFADRNA